MRILLSALVAATAAAVPAGAAITGTACAARLANAATGTTHTCDTMWLGDTGNTAGGFYRTVTLEVAAGSATGTLTCWTSYRTHTVSRTASGPGAVTFGTWDDQTCRLTVRAGADGTTATATSTSSYVVSWE